MIKAIIFDFDGTLVDSEKAIYECFQSITKQLAPERMEYAKNILIKNNFRAAIVFQPVYGSNLKKLVDLVLQDNLNVRVIPQIHKIIWGDIRGV